MWRGRGVALWGWAVRADARRGASRVAQIVRRDHSADALLAIGVEAVQRAARQEEARAARGIAAIARDREMTSHLGLELVAQPTAG